MDAVLQAVARQTWLNGERAANPEHSDRRLPGRQHTCSVDTAWKDRHRYAAVLNPVPRAVDCGSP